MPTTTPRSVTSRCTLVLKPPREYPSAWSGGSSSCAGAGPSQIGTRVGSFLRPARRPAGADDRGIDEPQFAAQLAVPLQVFQQVREGPGPRAIAGPAPEATVNRLPRAVPLRDVAPGSPRVEAPE